MKTIHKFPLEVLDMQGIQMPKGANILAVQVQNGTPCLWAEVDTKEPKEERAILMYGTGHMMSEVNDGSREYIGTFQLYGGGLVFHAYELKD